MADRATGHVTFNPQVTNQETVRLIRTENNEGQGISAFSGDGEEEMVQLLIGRIQVAPDDHQKVINLSRYKGTENALAVDIAIKTPHMTESIKKQVLCDTGALCVRYIIGCFGGSNYTARNR
jgi:hypothetical protein